MTETENNLFMDKDYYVVEFPLEAKEGETVPMGIIPYTWLIMNPNNSVECMWPLHIRGTTEFEKAVIMKYEIPKDECKFCPVNIKFKTNNYKTAVARLKDLEIQSSLSASQSDEELHRGLDENIGKRKIIKNQKYRDYSYLGDSDEDSLPVIPTIRKQGESSKSQIKSIKDPLDNTSRYKLVSPNRLKESSKANVEINKRRNNLDSLVDADENTDNSSTYSSQGAEPVVTFAQLSKCCRTTEVLIKKIYTKMEVISGDIQHLTQMMQHLHAPTTRNEDNPHLEKLPLSTKVELDEFNKILTDEEIFAELCTCLSIVGGKDCSDVLRRLLGRIISHELSLLINWSGRNGKKSFKDSSNVVKLIIAVTRKNSLCRNVTAAEIENIVKSWFRTAADRQGGRERRRHME